MNSNLNRNASDKLISNISKITRILHHILILNWNRSFFLRFQFVLVFICQFISSHFIPLTSESLMIYNKTGKHGNCNKQINIQMKMKRMFIALNKSVFYMKFKLCIRLILCACAPIQRLPT